MYHLDLKNAGKSVRRTWGRERSCEPKDQICNLLGEARSDIAPHSLRENIRQKQKEVQQRELPLRKKSRDRER